MLVEQLLHQRPVLRRRLGHEGPACGQVAMDLAALKRDLFDLVVVQVLDELRIVDVLCASLAARPLEQVEKEDQQDRDDDPKHQIAEIVQRGRPFTRGRGKR